MQASGEGLLEKRAKWFPVAKTICESSLTDGKTVSQFRP